MCVCVLCVQCVHFIFIFRLFKSLYGIYAQVSCNPRIYSVGIVIIWQYAFIVFDGTVKQNERTTIEYLCVCVCVGARELYILQQQNHKYQIYFLAFRLSFVR